jgi:glycosyltransferase involved in cell wall biosynthesis
VHVVTVAYPFAAVEESTAGGAEQIARILDAHIAQRGWQSTVIAMEGSVVRGNLVPVARVAGDLDDTEKFRTWLQCRDAIERVAAEAGVDLFHFHGVDFAEYLPDLDVPSLVTLHLPIDHYKDLQARTRFNCVSDSQRRTAPAGLYTTTIRNGIDLQSFTRRDIKQEFVLALGRICPEKGFHLALDAAHRAGVPMLLAGTVHPYPEHRRYFDREIAPRLDAQRQFIGAVGGAEKRELFAAAQCVIVPSLIAETSSLVAAEALASGTPVVALRRGALPEMVDDGVTGFLVDSVEEMAVAIRRAGSIDGARCRAAAEARFSSERMTREYFQLYETIDSI